MEFAVSRARKLNEVVKQLRTDAQDRLPVTEQEVSDKIKFLERRLGLLREMETKIGLMIGTTEKDLGRYAAQLRRMQPPNTECPFCGMPAKSWIQANETGLNYCSDRCATLHVKSLTPPKGGW